MSKTYTRLWLLAAMLGVLYPAYSQQNYSIQLCAFTEQVKPSFFDFAGFQNVQHQLISPLYHEYKWGNFSSPREAEQELISLQKNVSTHGLNNLKIVPTIPDFTIPLNDNNEETGEEQSTGFQLFTRTVNFTNPKLSLQKTDVEILEEVVNILEENPELKLRIYATKGSKRKKKRNISPTSSNIVKNFILAQNIPAYRIKSIESTDVIANSENPTSKVQQVFMTLVDLKEEIVLDRFGNDGYIAKELLPEKTLSAVEFIRK